MASHSSPDTDCINPQTFTPVLKEDGSHRSGNVHPRVPKVSSLDVSLLNHLYDIFRTVHLIKKNFFFTSISKLIYRIYPSGLRHKEAKIS